MAGAYRVRESRSIRFLPTTNPAAVWSSNTLPSRWTAGGSISAGVRLPLRERFALDVSSQLHGAALIGNHYAGGAGYAVFMLGVVVQ